MGESSNEKVGFFKGLKAEFQKIIWPDKTTRKTGGSCYCNFYCFRSDHRTARYSYAVCD